MGRWAQAQRRGGSVVEPILAPSAEFLEITLPDEDLYSIAYTGSVPAGVNQIETVLELLAAPGAGDVQNAASPGPVNGNTCNVGGTTPTPLPSRMRARWLFSGTPVSAFSDWVASGDIACV